MKRLLILSCVLLPCLAGRASAQGYFPRPSATQYPAANSNPPLSPMLNLRAGNNTPAINYFNQTLPLMQQRNFATYGPIPVDFAPVRRPDLLEESGDTLPQLPETGHPVRFMTY